MRRAILLTVAAALATAACGASPGAAARAPDPSAITVASFDFPESELLAQLYAQALRGAGFPVRVLANLGPRELVEPALAEGFVTVVPEYAGSALDFVSLGSTQPSPDAAVTLDALGTALSSWGVEALQPAPAQDANALVVTAETAATYGLRTISDLASSAPGLILGGPPECPQRPFCLLGLERVYGLRFERFQPLDAGGPLTLGALLSGGIDVALLFTTDPNIPAKQLVTLEDDRALQPAENVTPVIRREVLSRFGPGVSVALDEVSALLTTSELQAMVGRVTLSGQSPADVASRWLRGQGLATP